MRDEELKPRRWRVGSLAALLLFNFAAPAWAGEAEPKKKVVKKTRAPVELPALDRRIANAKMIVVGDAVRIFFVDRRYQEAPYIRAAGDGPTKTAMILVKVTKVLHPANAEVPARLFVPIETSKGDIFSDGRSPYDEQVARHVGKPGIWFGELKVVTEIGDDKSARKPLEDPIALLQAWDAKKRPVVSSLPIAQLKEVEASIARVKSEGERRKAETNSPSLAAEGK
jgi:hypothetical protein